jgi:hypothetical protein
MVGGPNQASPGRPRAQALASPAPNPSLLSTGPGQPGPQPLTFIDGPWPAWPPTPHFYRRAVASLACNPSLLSTGPGQPGPQPLTFIDGPWPARPPTPHFIDGPWPAQPPTPYFYWPDPSLPLALAHPVNPRNPGPWLAQIHSWPKSWIRHFVMARHEAILTPISLDT